MGIIIKWAELSKGYYYGEFLQHKPSLGGEVTGDTTDEEALDMIEKMLDRWHTKKTAGTAFESLKPITETTSTIQYQAPSGLPFDEYMNGIKESKTLEELQSYKLLASSNKELYNAYCSRLKELSI